MGNPMKTFLVTSNTDFIEKVFSDKTTNKHITDVSADDKNNSSSTYNIDVASLSAVVELVRTSAVK